MPCDPDLSCIWLAGRIAAWLADRLADRLAGAFGVLRRFDLDFSCPDVLDRRLNQFGRPVPATVRATPTHPKNHNLFSRFEAMPHD